MNTVDITVLALMGAGTILGLVWGIVRQVLSIAGLVVGIVLAGQFYEPLARFLSHPGTTDAPLIASINWARVVAFLGIVIVVLAVSFAASYALGFALDVMRLGWLDRALGGVVGLLATLPLVMVLLIVLAVFPIGTLTDEARQSQVAQWLSGFTPAVLALLPQEFQLFRVVMGF